jgi:ABC-type transport system involved in multi-copper enzyme maturation permease subunit
MSQTLAILHDGYREINSRRMFWASLILAGLVVASFAVVGINERGWTLFGHQFDDMIFNTKIVPRPMFYSLLFSTLGVGFWLTWIGMALALISTCGIIPEFIAGGSIDLYLSKPVSRPRLFLTKYASALRFVALQVLVFSAASFLLIGLRGGSWNWRLFYAVPIVVLVFSYLFCVAVLLALLTRSTIASLLLTLLFWMLVFGVDTTEKILLTASTAGQIETEAYASNFGYLDREAQLLRERVASGDKAAQEMLDNSLKKRGDLEAKKAKSDPARKNVALAQAIALKAKSVLPKTAETNALLNRWLQIDEARIAEERGERREQRRAARRGWLPTFNDRTEVRMDDQEVQERAAETLRDRSAGWVIGTSLAFEAVILALATWLFCRRDF